MDIKEEKKELRKIIKQKVKELLEDYCKQADAQIRERVIELPEYIDAKTIFCYVGTDQEINTFPLLQMVLESGKTLVVPKCITRGIMKAYQIKTLEELELGAYGIMEPKEECVCVEPERIDLVIVPCLSCTKDGKRLGFGGGFYDRYLERVQAPKVLLCREQVMEKEIPIERHDLMMDILISEKETKRIG